jgi:large conductance mechanosensitive channel
MRGNLVELAVAFIMAAAFGAVIKAFTDMILSIIGKAGGNPNFNVWKPGGVPVGVFLTALISFLIVAAIIYFFVVKPYEMLRERYAKQEEDAAPDEDVLLLREIRDALTRRV